MTFLPNDSGTTTATPSRSPRETIATGLLADAVFGTSSGVSMRSLRGDVFGITTVPVSRPDSIALGIAGEVQRLRDLAHAAGLSRIVLARLLGVDRRSLSGWASGEMRPTPDRVAAVQSISRVLAEIQSEYPGRARDVLAVRRGSRTLIDSVSGGTSRLEDWRSWLARSNPELGITMRPQEGEPIWGPAARAFAQGDLTAPTWERTLRSESTYEMNPDRDARGFAEPEYESGRRGLG